MVPQDPFHTKHGGTAKRFLEIFVRILTYVVLAALNKRLQHLTMPIAGVPSIPSLFDLKKWGFVDIAR